MTTRAIPLCVLGVAAVLFVSDRSGALASSPRAPVGQSDGQSEFAHLELAAWEKMQESLLSYFSEDGAARLKFMVYHAVAAEVCGDDIRMDVAKAAQMVMDIHPENWAQLTEQDKALWNNKFIGNYGMVYGIMLAEHTHDIRTLCSDAAALAADPEGGSLFVPPDTRASAGR